MRVDLADDDLVARPWDYPGTVPPGSRLLTAGRALPLLPRPGRRLAEAWVAATGAPHGEGGPSWPDRLDDALLAAGAAPLGRRHLVVAVGSNASPAVLTRKLTAARASTTVPWLRTVVTGLGAGHSAHVSVPGFVAAAPVVRPGAALAGVALLLDDRQLAGLDATEPSYRRRWLPATAGLRIVLAGGGRPGGFAVYESRRGVLAPPGGQPLPLLAQREVHRRLRDGCPGFADLVPGGDPDGWMRAFAAHPECREEAARVLVRGGWVDGSGLTGDRLSGVQVAVRSTKVHWGERGRAARQPPVPDGPGSTPALTGRGRRSAIEGLTGGARAEAR